MKATKLSTEDVERALVGLQELGLLNLTNDVITYRNPTAAYQLVAQSTVADANDAIDAILARSSGFLARLPELQAAWQLGDSDQHSIEVDVFHGLFAPADIWMAQKSRRVPVWSKVMMPTTGPLFESQPVHQASFWADQAGSDIRVQLIMSVEDATNPLAQSQIEIEQAAGAEIRMHPNPPSWCWVTDDDTTGLPFVWGEGWPSSVMSLSSPAVAAAIGWIFDRVWEQSVPVGESHHAWESMLSLMRRGLTMEAATRTLGLAPRTGRRRVAEAMAHYGVSTPFALGAAWQAEAMTHARSLTHTEAV